MQELIQVLHLSKKFGERTVVDDLSFSVQEGEIYGFLGQNGAGKSTTIRMLLTLVRPTSGSIHLFGRNMKEHRLSNLKRIGAIIEKPDLYNYLTAIENLGLMAKLGGKHLNRISLLGRLERVGLKDRADSRVKSFSQGMKQRLGLACALVNDPDLLILDEPTNGLDPQGIADVRNLMLQLSRHEGKTILVSSHLLSEMELLADSMLIIDRGKKITEGRMDILLNPADTLVAVEVNDKMKAERILAGSQWAGSLIESTHLLLRMHRNDIPQLNKFLVNEGIEVLSLQPKHSLEDYFLSITTSNRHVAAYQD
jgi:ABC-type multidrug transport system ATPase subunit